MRFARKASPVHERSETRKQNGALSSADEIPPTSRFRGPHLFVEIYCTITQAIEFGRNHAKHSRCRLHLVRGPLGLQHKSCRARRNSTNT